MSALLTELPPALSGARHELTTPGVGRLSWYQDAPPAPVKDARPLVLVHSINAAGSAYEVKPLYDYFRSSRPVYALDLPGFGMSERSRRPYGPRLMTDAVHAMVAQVQQAHGGVAVDAIALSLSSEYLARAAAEAPTAYRTVGLVSPTGFNRAKLREGPPCSDRGQAGLYSVMGSPRFGRWLYEQLTRRSVIAYFLGRTWGSNNIDTGLLDYDCLISRPQGAEHAPLRFLTGFLFGGDSGTVYRALRCPVWVVHGVRGDFTNYVGLEAFRDNPKWKVDVLPTGALPHFEMLPEFIRAYRTWMQTLGVEA